MTPLLWNLSRLFIALAAGAVACVAWFFVRYPSVGPAPSISIPLTAPLVERGRYLANHVAGCVSCHSTRDWDAYSGPVVPGTEGAGGERFGKELGLPGTFYAPNITPAALRQWTDGEIVRAITAGVTRTGRAIFPVMSHPNFRALSKQDAEAIVAYLKTLQPVPREIPPSKPEFPMNVLVRTRPRPYVPPPPADRTRPIDYGRYLAGIAGCEVCHTPSGDRGPVEAMAYAGGVVFEVPRAGRVESANITPDPQTGLGEWPRDFFVARFRDAASAGTRLVPARGERFNTLMPWTMFRGMTDEDLGAIYDYLRTVKPVHHPVRR